MSGTIRMFTALVLAFTCAASSYAQAQEGYEGELVRRSPEPTEPPPPNAIVPATGLSDWITYRRNLVGLGPVDGPPRMANEFYLRMGPSIPVGGQAYSEVLGVGWMIQGGVRFIFFNADATNAWTIDVGLSHHHNDATDKDRRFPLNIFRDDLGIRTDVLVTPLQFDRTFVNLGFGKEWWLWGSAGEMRQWRVGCDAGGRYGSAKGEYHEITHRTDVIGGAFAAAHTDIEFPRGCCTYFGGARCEWAYTWSDILQQPSDLMEINALFNVGVRY